VSSGAFTGASLRVLPGGGNSFGVRRLDGAFIGRDLSRPGFFCDFLRSRVKQQAGSGVKPPRTKAPSSWRTPKS